MSGRSPVPSELRRAVLVEAGHRCAIHTCRHPAYDVHHIVPWEQCHKHDFTNLIALCPNCHRRADRGEIDHGSLRLYKSGLGVRVPGPGGDDGVTPGTSIGRLWLTRSIIESMRSERSSYDSRHEFPEFLPNAGELAEFNDLQRVAALKRLHRVRSDFYDQSEAEVVGKPVERAASTAYTVELFTGAAIAVRYEHHDYTGGTHGSRTTEVVNYGRNPLVPLSLRMLFEKPERAARGLSEYCIGDLERENDDKEPNPEVRRGAAPDLANFERFSLAPLGITVTFEERVVGPYSEGPRKVAIPTSVLRPWLRGGAARLWS